MRIVLALLFAMATAARPHGNGKRVGIQFVNWFYGQDGDCHGPGWYGQGPSGPGPFGFAPGSVRSRLWPAPGRCYSTVANDSDTAARHAAALRDLGVDFVAHDLTNFAKAMDADKNPDFIAAQNMGRGMWRSGGIRSTHTLSLTCWAEQCWGAAPSAPNATTEFFTFNNHTLSHVEAIAAMDPQRAVVVDGLPLLLIYLNAGSNVMAPHSNPPRQAFAGPGHLIPTAAQFNPLINMAGRPVRIRDIFTVRYLLTCGDGCRFDELSNEIWGFECAGECSFGEAGWAALRRNGTRNPSHFHHWASAAANQSLLFVRCWNEYSSTDEHGANSASLEPNNKLATVDGSPGRDPWYMFSQVKAILHQWKNGTLLPTFTPAGPIFDAKTALDVRDRK